MRRKADEVERDRAAQANGAAAEQLLEQTAQGQEEIAQLGEERDASQRTHKRAHAAMRAADARLGARTPEEAAAVQEVFAAWQRLFGYGDEKLTKVRRASILARLRAGYTVEQLVAVLTWASRDDWTRGRDPKSTRPYDDLSEVLQPMKFDARLLRATHGSRSLTKSARLLGKPGQHSTKIRILGAT